MRYKWQMGSSQHHRTYIQIPVTKSQCLRVKRNSVNDHWPPTTSSSWPERWLGGLRLRNHHFTVPAWWIVSKLMGFFHFGGPVFWGWKGNGNPSNIVHSHMIPIITPYSFSIGLQVGFHRDREESEIPRQQRQQQWDVRDLRRDAPWMRPFTCPWKCAKVAKSWYRFIRIGV